MRKIRKRSQTAVNSVKALVDNDPQESVRNICKKTGLKRWVATKILKTDLGKKCVKTVRAQRVRETQQEKRLRACKIFTDEIKNGSLDVKSIFFTDEKLFNVNAKGRRCSQNYRAWVDKGLKKKDIQAKDIVRGGGRAQGGISVMAALGVCHNGVGTLTFVEEGVEINLFVYLDTLKNAYRPDMEMIMGGDYVLQQDGATAHTAKSITKWIKEQGKFM